MYIKWLLSIGLFVASAMGSTLLASTYHIQQVGHHAEYWDWHHHHDHDGDHHRHGGDHHHEGGGHHHGGHHH